MARRGGRYDAAGNRQYKRFADGSEEGYGYDAVNRLTRVDYPSGRHVEYAYDAVGNRVNQVDMERPAVTQWAVSATASDAFDPAKNATGAPDGYSWKTSQGTGWLETTFPGGRARAVRVHEAGGAPLVTRVDLVDDGGMAHTVYSGGDQTGNGGWLVVPLALTDYRVVKVKVWVAQGGGQSAGMIAVDTVGLDVQPEDRYQYNGFNQLLSVTGTDGTSTYFGYDGNGNETKKTETSPTGAVSTTTYAYDGDNRLVGIQLPTGLSNAFEYDANGLRTKKTDSSGTTRYLLDGLSVIAQYAPDATRQAFYTQSLARIDEVLSVVNDAGKYWYQTDALGSVYGLSSTSGKLVANQDYDVFGALVPEQAGPAGQPFGFTGREHELDSGLVYARARYLNPSTGRWDRPDPLTAFIASAGGFAAEPWMLRTGAGTAVPVAGSSRYLYTANPAAGIDPSGLTVMYAGFGATAGAGVGTTYGIGGVWGNGDRGFSYALALTAGLAVQVGPSLKQLVNVSVTAEVGYYWGLRTACDYGGPFISIGADLTEFSVALVWSVSWEKFNELKTGGAASAFAVAMDKPVGFTLGVNVLPILLPNSGVTITATYSWLPSHFNCDCP